MFPIPEKEYSVVVVTLTYNHKAYIEETLKGIVMQQTSFPMVACVLDDCSTDGTTDIVRKYESQYPDLIKGFYFEENQFSQGKFTFSALVPWLRKTKYIALCEGDDYWTDSLKLQKQVDFMESHLESVMSFHRVIGHWQDGSAPDKVFFPVEDRIYKGSEIFNQWVVATASVMIRSDIFKQSKLQEILNNKGLMYYDQAIYMYCSVVGEVWGMSDVMAVYRRLHNGFTCKLNSDLNKSYTMIERYCSHLRCMNEIFCKHLGDDIKRVYQSRCVSKLLDGCLLSLSNRDLRHFRLFFKMAYACDPQGIYISVLKKIVRQFVK